MKYMMTAVLFALLMLARPQGLPAAAPEHGGHEVQTMQHGGMTMGGDMIMLEEKTVDGVQGMVHLNDVGEAMAKMGMKENFHFMIMFTDVATGAAVAEGAVALKVTGPSGKEGEPLALTAMDGMFGADLALAEKGAYRFTVGSKLADGKKRQFVFDFTRK